MFQVHPLPAGSFAHLYSMSDEDLAARNVQVHLSDGAFPCRVSLADAAEGERVFLLNFEHQSGDTPYRSRHAVFVKDGAVEDHPLPGSVPACIASRFLSVRAFDKTHEMVDADVIEGSDVQDLIATFFADPKVDYLHLHYARRGCFAAKVTRPVG